MSPSDEAKMSPSDEEFYNAIDTTHLLYMCKYLKASISTRECETYKSEADQKTSSTKDEEKTTVAAEQEINPVFSKETKKATGAPSEVKTRSKIKDQSPSCQVDTPISKDDSSFAAGDCPEVAKVEDVNKIDQVDSLKGEFHISFESKDSLDVVKTTDGSVKGEESMREVEVELRAAINKGMRRGFLLPKESKKAPDFKKADSLVLNDCIPSFEAGDCPNVTNVTSTDDSLLPKELHLSYSAADDCLEATKKRDDPVNGEEADSLVLNDCIPSFEAVLLPKESNKAPDFKKADSLVLNDCIPSFEAVLLPKESNKAPDFKKADSLVLNDCIPSFEAGDCPNVTNVTSTVDSLLPKELHLSSSAVDDCLEVAKTRDDPDEEEWHDEDTHGSFNPADPKCKCAIS